MHFGFERIQLPLMVKSSETFWKKLEECFVKFLEKVYEDAIEFFHLKGELWYSSPQRFVYFMENLRFTFFKNMKKKN